MRNRLLPRSYNTLEVVESDCTILYAKFGGHGSVAVGGHTIMRAKLDHAVT